MKAIRLRSYGDAMGATIDVEAHFAPIDGQTVIDRLIQVATIIQDAGSRANGVHDYPLAATATVTRIETDFLAGHVTVSACVPEGATAEKIQRSLIELIPVK
jgi:hypothetical protein